MNGRRSTCIAAIVACAVGLGCAGTAYAASAFVQTYNAYRQAGKVAPCQFPVGTLQKATSQVPPDIEQYAPDFPAALDAALHARALGACGQHGPTAATASAAAAPASAAPPSPGAGGGGGSPAPAATSSPAAATPAPRPLAIDPSTAIVRTAAIRRGGGASSAPAPIIALAIVLVVMAFAGVWWTLTSLRGLEPRWLVGARHAWSEAAYRAGGTWAEFADWVRLGR